MDRTQNERISLKKERTESLVAQALKNIGNDRYMLDNLVFARVKQLNAGAKTLVNMDPKRHKLVDIAIREIAEGKIDIDRIDERN
ncbi:DNA-directed RNA polymerase subunit omega [Helicobacter pylori]|nr:DNA-directed RNA polymerase subunit omega [Helicobacter pylori]RVY28198.1 DNA-directed RNA polymerase subunit omega [Helicobacter pylori]